MKHITERYKEPCNHIELTDDEFKQLWPFLKKLGVEIRPIIWHGKTGEYQARNPYKNELLYIDSAAREFCPDNYTEYVYKTAGVNIEFAAK